MPRQTATTASGNAPELGIVPGPSPAADGQGAPESASNPMAAELQSLRETLAQQGENQKLMYAALQAIGNQSQDYEPEEPEAPAVHEYNFPEIEGLEAMTGPMRKSLGEIMYEAKQARAESQKLRAEIAGMRRQDHFGFFQAATPGWENQDKGMAEIFEKLHAEPRDVETLKYVHKLASNATEVERLRAEVAALKKSGPVPKLTPPMPGLRQRLSKHFPDRGNLFGPGDEFRANLEKIRLRGGDET